MEELTFESANHHGDPSYGTFGGCTNLEMVTFEEGSQLKVLQGAFAYCSKLETITIPETFEVFDEVTLGYSTFRGCSNLKTIYLLSPNPPSAPNYYFTDYFIGTPDDLIIYVPRGSLTAYQTAGAWSDMADHIQEMP